MRGSETWIIRKRERKRINGQEIYVLNLKWSDKVRNEDFLRRMGEKRGY